MVAILGVLWHPWLMFLCAQAGEDEAVLLGESFLSGADEEAERREEHHSGVGMCACVCVCRYLGRLYAPDTPAHTNVVTPSPPCLKPSQARLSVCVSWQFASVSKTHLPIIGTSHSM